MIGKVLSRIREERKITKTDLAKMTDINIGHLTHIEKEERNPSHKALRALCDALQVPYQPLMYTYDRELTEEQENYKVQNHVKYDSIPIVDSIIGYAACPTEVRNASFVMRSFNDAMAPKILDDDFVYIELSSPLSKGDIGLFEYDGRLIIRKFVVRKNDIVLRAENNEYDDIIINKDANSTLLEKFLQKITAQCLNMYHFNFTKLLHILQFYYIF